MIEDGSMMGAYEPTSVTLADQMRNKAASLERRGFGAHVSLLEAYAQTSVEESGARLRELSNPIDVAIQQAQKEGKTHWEMPREQFERISSEMDSQIGRGLIGALLPTIQGIVAEKTYSTRPFAARMEMMFSGTVLRSKKVEVEEDDDEDITPVMQRNMTELARNDKSFASIIRGNVLPPPIRRYLEGNTSLSGKPFIELVTQHVDTYEEDAQELVSIDDVLPESLVKPEDPYTASVHAFVADISETPIPDNATRVVHHAHHPEEHDVFTKKDREALKAFLDTQP